jgi:hypothetical protein
MGGEGCGERELVRLPSAHILRLSQTEKEEAFVSEDALRGAPLDAEGDGRPAFL